MRNLSNSNSSSNNNRSRSCTRPLIDPRYGLYPSSADVKMEIYLAHAHTRGRQTRRKKRMRNPQLASIIRHWQIVGRKCRAAVWLLVASTSSKFPVFAWWTKNSSCRSLATNRIMNSAVGHLRFARRVENYRYPPACPKIDDISSAAPLKPS